MSALAVLGVGLVAGGPYLVAGVSRSFINLDDPQYVYENPLVLKGLTPDGVRWALTTFSSSNWHPLTWLSHMLDCTLFGRNAFGHHLTSLVLHALSAALLFLALRRMTGSPWRSALVAGLFGVHPLHVESVAWVAERKDVLSGLCLVLVMLAYESYVRRGGARRYLGVVLFLALGLAAKPMLVTTPFLLLLLDVWPFGRTSLTAPGGGGRQPVSWTKLVLEKAPLLMLTIASSVVTLHAQHSGGALIGMETIAAAPRIANALESYGRYLGKTVWPASLGVYYPLAAAGYPWWHPVLAALGLTGITALAGVRLRRWPHVTVGWLWFLGMLVPVIGLVQVGYQSMADRYTYLPHIGLFVAASWALAEVSRARLWSRLAAGIGSVALLILLALVTASQAANWHDGLTLYRRTLALTKGNWVIHDNLGALLDDKGRYAEAVEHYGEAIRIYPTNARTHNNLAVTLAKLGRLEDAVRHYRNALRLEPALTDCRLNLANLLIRLGRREEALAELLEIVRVRPSLTEARFKLGNVLVELGLLEGAVQQYREVLRQMPGLAPTYLKLGNALHALGRFDEAASIYRSLLARAPNSIDARKGLDASLARTARP